ncbi:MAG: hypothetical protein N3E48_00145 [Candidatus Bathyarchaeota archaeon]|nr:hypothetical protein [Candidatus Bathyarchaeota archaeon]
MLRSAKVYGSLYKAWQDTVRLITTAGITAEKLYESLLPTFSDMYNDLFEFLFGPVSLFTPSFSARNLETASKAIEYFKSILEAWRNIAKTIGTSKEIREYFDILSTAWGPFEVFFRTLRALFLLPPKELVLNWSKLLDIYGDLLKYWSGYHSKLYEAWVDSSKRFTEKIAGLAQEAKPITFEEFHQAWIKVFEEAYSEVLKSPEVISLQTLLMNSSMDLIACWKKNLEILLSHMQILPIPTLSEIDEINKVVSQLKKELNLLAKKVETLTGSGSSPGG